MPSKMKQGISCLNASEEDHLASLRPSHHLTVAGKYMLLLGERAVKGIKIEMVFDIFLGLKITFLSH
jgi:hypothetical protein